MARRFKTIKTGPVRGPVIVKKSFSNRKLAGILDDMMAEGLNIMGKNVLDGIHNNLDMSLDINDNRLEPLAPSTLAKRQAKGQGTTNSSKSRYPNAKVEKREWFGITKEMKPGGSDYKKTIAQIKLRLRNGWKFI